MVEHQQINCSKSTKVRLCSHLHTDSPKTIRMQSSNDVNATSLQRNQRSLKMQFKGIKVWHLKAAERTQGTKPSNMAGKNLRDPNVNQLHN